MRNRIINILVLFVLCLVHSCIEKESFEPVQSQTNGTVVFSATPKGFTTANVGTKADGDESDEGFDPNVFENTIYNAFFLLFDNNGLLRVKGIATVNEDNKTVTYNVGRNVLSIFPSSTICFLANVHQSYYDDDFVVGKTTWTSLQSSYFSLTYAPVAETGCIGVPVKTDLNGDGVQEYALPMFGSKEITEPYSDSKDYSFKLERLFARVELHVSLGIQEDNSILTSEPQFSMVECEMKNIPTRVPLLPQSGATECANVADSQVSTKLHSEKIGSYNLTPNVNKTLYYSPSTAKEYKSIYFYLPEHKLGDCGSNSVQANKPTLIGGTQRPACISISGYLVDGEGTSFDAKYNIYLGGNSTDNFDLSRNTIYKNYVRINGTSSADHRVEKMDEIKEVINDVTREGQAANCYIITAEGTYLLPAYKGAFSSLANAEMCETGTNVLLACDNPNITITFNEELSKQSTIVFNVTNSSDLLSGNAVIARLNGETGEVEWSWHLWFIPGLDWGSGSNSDLGATNRIGGLLTRNMYDNNTMADRNLGMVASVSSLETWMPATIIGTYYRYGHRNPLIEDKKYGSGTAYHGLKEDDYASWEGSVKSKTDPCPPGYRVPPKSIWEGSNASNATNEHYEAEMSLLGIDVIAYRYWNSGSSLNITDDIYYPYGYMTPSGEKSVETTNMPFVLTDELSETSSRNEGTASPSNPGRLEYQYRTVTYTRTSYTDIKYIVPAVTCHVGSVLSRTDGKSVIFKASTNNVQKTYITNNSLFVSCRKTVTTVSATERRRRNLISGYTDWTEYGTPTESVTSDETITDRNLITADWKNTAANELIGRYSSSALIGTSVIDNLDSDYGYQVRCVQER